MRFLLRSSLVVLSAACLAGPIAAQEAAKQTAPPKPAPSAFEALLMGWNYECGKLLAMAEDFPEDKYDFKPNPAQRSFAEQLLHLTGGHYAFINAAQGQSTAERVFARDKYKTKAEIVALLKKSIEEGAALIKAKGDAGLDATVLSPWGNYKMRLSDLAYSVLVHSAEHYGQLVVYYRVNNLVPPDSRSH
jgi:uncharacterized damage-inducible protein DinB